MATIKAIRRRIASAQSTQQITRALKLVSAARLRRAQEALINGRPYAETLARVAGSLLESERAALAAAEEATPAALMVVIASDRGSCGAYNANLLKRAAQQIRGARERGLSAEIFAVGRKAVQHFNRTKVPIAGDSTGNRRLATLELAARIAQRMLEAYRGGEVGEVGLVYSRFRSALSQQPVWEQVLPLAERSADGQRETAAVDYLTEPNRAELVPVVVQSYVESAVFHALLEAEASDHAARMTAMDNATNNATDMINSLTLAMNRARQAGITRELMDIVGGAEAISG